MVAIYPGGGGWGGDGGLTQLCRDPDGLQKHNFR